MNNTAVKICGTGEDTSLEKMAKVMTGADKEALQGCDRGVFYVKVKRQGGIIQQAFGTNHARPLRNTTKLLGFRNAMSKKQWKRVKQLQIEKYYRSLKPSQAHSEAELFTPNTNAPEGEPTLENENTGFLRGFGKKSLSLSMEAQKTPAWIAEHLKASEPENQTPAPESETQKPPVPEENKSPGKAVIPEAAPAPEKTPEPAILKPLLKL